MPIRYDSQIRGALPPPGPNITRNAQRALQNDIPYVPGAVLGTPVNFRGDTLGSKLQGGINRIMDRNPHSDYMRSNPDGEPPKEASDEGVGASGAAAGAAGATPLAVSPSFVGGTPLDSISGVPSIAPISMDNSRGQAVNLMVDDMARTADLGGLPHGAVR